MAKGPDDILEPKSAADNQGCVDQLSTCVSVPDGEALLCLAQQAAAGWLGSRGGGVEKDCASREVVEVEIVGSGKCQGDRV